MATTKSKVIVVLGLTASGKSALAIKLARFLGTSAARKRFGINGAEIISADSRQVYKGMDIGTGKVAKKEMRGIPHHLLDVVSPQKIFTVVDFQKFARRAIEKIVTKNKIPIICGGTGFYIDAALYNYSLPTVKADKKLRRTLEQRSAAELFERLLDLDPRRAERIDRKNKRRLIRALEIVMSTGGPVPPPEDAQKKISPYEVLKIGIILPPETLHVRIRKRLLARIRQGMIAEVARLHKQGVSWQRLNDLGLEYRYIGRYLRGEFLRQEMIAELEKAIRRYAKRQMTWFKRDKDIHWISGADRSRELVQDFLTANPLW